MIRKQLPNGLLKTAGHLVSMPRHNVNLEELLRARFWIPSNASDRYFGRFANTAEAYSITDRLREQYTVIMSDVQYRKRQTALCDLCGFITRLPIPMTVHMLKLGSYCPYLVGII